MRSLPVVCGVTLVLLAASCIPPAPRKPERKTVKPITATDGVATLPDGSKVWLIGACDLSAKQPEPWDAEGKPLNNERAKEFWATLDLPKENPYASDPSNRTFAMAYGFSKKWNLKPPLEDHNTRFDLAMMGGGSKARLGEGQTAFGIILKPLKPNQPFDFRLTANGGEWKTVATFRTTDEYAAEGFKYRKLQGFKSNMFVATKESREELPVERWTWAIKVPKSLMNDELQLTTNDPKPAGKFDKAVMSGPGMKGELMDPQYKDWFIFMIQYPVKEGFDRVYRLESRPQYTITFPDIPLKRRT